MSLPFLMLVGCIYLLCSILQLIHKNYPVSLMLFGYFIGNIALWFQVR